MALHRKDDRLRARRRGKEIGKRIEATAPRQIDVDDEEVSLEGAQLAQSRLRIGCLADDLDPLAEQRAEARPDDGVIINDEGTSHRTTWPQRA